MSLCPFYGTRFSEGELRKSMMKNQCALKQLLSCTRPTPCHMEMAGARPQWKGCFYRRYPEIQKAVREVLHEIKEAVPA